MTGKEEKWRQEEFKRWEDVFPEMKRGEIRKEVDTSEESRQEEFKKQKEEFPWLGDEEILEIVEAIEQRKNFTKRLRRFLISEDIKKISEQLDEVFGKGEEAMNEFTTIREKVYEERIVRLKEEEKAIEDSKGSANTEKLQYEILKQLEEIKYDSLRSSLRVEGSLRVMNHDNLKSQLPLIGVLREMKKNSRPWLQIRIGVIAAILGSVFGTVATLITTHFLK